MLSSASSQGCVFSHVRLFATPWTAARQAPLSMGFSRQEYCSGLSFPTPGDLPDPGIEPASISSPGRLPGRFFTTMPPGSFSPYSSLNSPNIPKNFKSSRPLPTPDCSLFLSLSDGDSPTLTSLLSCFSCSVVPLCDPVDCSTLGFPVLHHLPEFAQTHVH